MPERLPTLSAAQKRAVDGSHESGRVYATQQTIAALIRLRVVERPMYRYGRGHSWAELTTLGLAIRAKRRQDAVDTPASTEESP